METKGSSKTEPNDAVLRSGRRIFVMFIMFTDYHRLKTARLRCSCLMTTVALSWPEGSTSMFIMFIDNHFLCPHRTATPYVHHVHWKSSPVPHRIAAPRLRIEQAASRQEEYLRIRLVNAHCRKRWFSSLEVSPELPTPQRTTATYSSGVGKALCQEFVKTGGLELGTSAASDD